MKLQVHINTIVIYIQYKFNNLPSILTKLWLRMEKIIEKSIKGNNSSITDDTLIKLYMHIHTIVIYIQYKFHEILSVSCLVMAEDRKNHRKLGNQRAITPLQLMTL